MHFHHVLPASNVLFGKGTLKEIGKETSRWGRNALLVTGKSSMKRLGFLEKTINSLEDEGVDVVHYGEVEPNPTTLTVNRGAEITLEEDRNVVVALGGGSAMDAAKAIAVVAGHYDDEGEISIWDYVVGEAPITDRTLPVITATSTSGTGSHVTPYSVLTNPETNGKPGFGEAPMFPKVSIVDMEILRKMPPRLTAITGFDVYSHVSENLISRGDHPTADPYAIRAIEYVAEYLPRAYEDGDDMEAREKMAVADTYAGLSNTIASTALRHAMGHSISGHYPQIPHGQALASVAIPIMKYNIENGDERTRTRYSKIATALGALESPSRSKDSALKAVEAVEDLLETLDLDKSMSETGVKEDRIAQMTEDTFTYMKGDIEVNPAEVGEKEVEDIFREAY